MALIEDFSIEDKRLRPYAGMTDGQLKRGEGFRRDHPQGMFIGESSRVIERAIESGIKPLSMLVEAHWLDHDRAIIDAVLRRNPATPIFVATVDRFRAITGYEVVRGALACFERPAEVAVEDVLANARRLALLEDVGNYTNMGAIFRSAAALGMDGILLSPSCHDPYYRRCARVSMGAVFQVPWARIPAEQWPSPCIEGLRERGFAVAAMALDDGALGIRESGLIQAQQAAVVLGTEGEGLARSTIDSCDFTIKIPMAHGVDSLNVAAAAAIAFWELCA